MGKAIGSAFKAVGKFFKSTIGKLVSPILGFLFGGGFGSGATASGAADGRLQVSLVPEERRKIVFGETACATDLRYWETYGKSSFVQVLAAACHKVESFGNLYAEEKLVTFNGAGTANNAPYSGILRRKLKTVGVSGAGIPVGTGTYWNANSAMTGCAHFVLDWDYIQDRMANGIPTRITQVVKGAPVYDPRKDGSRGGVGLHRPDNQDTWEYAPVDPNGKPIGRNNALQMLAYLIGFRIARPADGVKVLVAGRGVEIDDIDFASFVQAANDCELEGWYSDCILSTEDEHGTNEGVLAAASGGDLSDAGGRWSYFVATDDTANIALTLTDDDFVGSFNLSPSDSMSEQFNEIAGEFVDPGALFQYRPVPLVFDAAYYAIDGYKRRKPTVKFGAVQDPAQAQKLLRIMLNRSRFQERVKAEVNLKGLKVKYNSILKVNFKQFEWTDKLFRVVNQGISATGAMELELEETHSSIFAPGAVVAVPAPSQTVSRDGLEKEDVTGLGAVASGVIGSGGTAVDALVVTWILASENIARLELRYRKVGAPYWTYAPALRREETQVQIAPLQPSTAYEVQLRTISLTNVPGDWAATTQTTNAVTVNSAGQMVYSNGSTVESLRPAEAGAQITTTRIAAGIAGQGWGATASEALAGNRYVAVGENSIVNSEYRTSLIGVDVSNATNANTTGLTRVFGHITTATDYGGQPRTTLQANVSGTPAAGTVFDIAHFKGDGDVRQWALPVMPSNRFYGSAYLAGHRTGVFALSALVLKANGAYLSEVTLWGGAVVQNTAHKGDPALMTLASGYYDIPASGATFGGDWSEARYVYLFVRVYSSGGKVDPYGWATAPMLALVPAGQIGTMLYRPGRANPRADETYVNTAGAVVGQGPLATTTPPAYASNAAAFAALGAGRLWSDNTTALPYTVKTTVDPATVPSFTLTRGTPSVSYVGTGTGSRTTAVTTNTESGTSGTVTRSWRQVTNNFTGWTIVAPSSLNTAFRNNLTTGASLNDQFELTVINGDGTSQRIYVMAVLTNTA